MAKRTKEGWVAPRSGGYSARSAESGRYVAKPLPPKGRGSASQPTNASQPKKTEQK
jgi:hypothetical protein